jgi:poly(A) polymerase
MFGAPAAGSLGPRRLDISYPTTEFTKLVKMWDKYDNDKMGIVVRHIKRSVKERKYIFTFPTDKPCI